MDVVDSDMISRGKFRRQIRNLLERVCEVETEIIQCFYSVAHGRHSSCLIVNLLRRRQRKTEEHTNETGGPFLLPGRRRDRR